MPQLSASDSQEFYDELHRDAGIFTKVIRRDNFTYYQLVRVIERYLRPDARVLDVGCGQGAISLYVASRGGLVTGIDISERAVAACRESARRLGLDARASFEARSFTDAEVPGSFDMVLCLEVLEHLPDDRRALQSIKRLLAPGGVAILSVPSENSPIHRRRLKRLGRDLFDEQAGHLRRYTQPQVTGLIADAGLEVTKVRATEGVLRHWLFVTPTGRLLLRFVRFWLSHVVTALDNLALQVFGEAQLIVVARKPTTRPQPPEGVAL